MSQKLIDGQARFERDVEALMGDRLRDDDDFCVRLWSSLAGITWIHASGDFAYYSMRASGDVIADILDDGSDYTEWYLSGPRATVDGEIAAALATRGWHWVKE